MREKAQAEEIAEKARELLENQDKRVGDMKDIMLQALEVYGRGQYDKAILLWNRVVKELH